VSAKITGTGANLQAYTGRAPSLCGKVDQESSLPCLLSSLAEPRRRTEHPLAYQDTEIFGLPRRTLYWQNANGMCLPSRLILTNTVPKRPKTRVTSSSSSLSEKCCGRLITQSQRLSEYLRGSSAGLTLQQTCMPSRRTSSGDQPCFYHRCTP